jgi:hypothetical protein
MREYLKFNVSKVKIVMAAKAGIQVFFMPKIAWIPAAAGMTENEFALQVDMLKLLARRREALSLTRS